MRKEIRDELSDLIRDRGWLTATAYSIPFPVIVGVLLAVIGNPDVLKIGVYAYFFLFVLLNARSIWLAKKSVKIENYHTATTEEEIVDRYPHLRPYAMGSAVFSIMLTIILVSVPPINRPIVDLINGTPTPTPTLTPTVTLTFTPTPVPSITPSPTNSLTPSFTPTISVSRSKYYVIVVDASEKMQESFGGRSKFQAALQSIDIILEGLDPDANYSLIVIGGSTPVEGVNPCDEPSVVKYPFTSQDIVNREIVQLQPAGGGSLYTAFNLARNQFRALQPDTTRTLIYITGSSDACENRMGGYGKIV
jgi:hypothetical protein